MAYNSSCHYTNITPPPPGTGSPCKITAVKKTPALHEPDKLSIKFFFIILVVIYKVVYIKIIKPNVPKQ